MAEEPDLPPLLFTESLTISAEVTQYEGTAHDLLVWTGSTQTSTYTPVHHVIVVFASKLHSHATTSVHIALNSHIAYNITDPVLIHIIMSE